MNTTRVTVMKRHHLFAGWFCLLQQNLSSGGLGLHLVPHGPQLLEHGLACRGLLVTVFIEMNSVFIGAKPGAREGLPLVQAAQLVIGAAEIRT